MRPDLRRNAFALCLLGTAFLLHFQMAKHWRPWSIVSPFAEDPYDAVGSFAVQFVLFMMLVSLFRAFRSSSDEASDTVFARGALMTAVAVAFTCLSDIVAMARRLPLWSGKPQGTLLFAATLLLALWAAAAAAWFLLSAHNPPRRADIRKLAIPAAALVLLAVYPESFRNSILGAVLTALCGSLLLFIAVWSVGTSLLPASEITRGRDAPAPSSSSGFRTADSGKPQRQEPSLRHGRLRRRAGWILALLLGLVCGAILVAQELAQPGPSPHGSRRLLVIAVYLFLESAGVLVGYGLLAKPLGLLFRE